MALWSIEMFRKLHNLHNEATRRVAGPAWRLYGAGKLWSVTSPDFPHVNVREDEENVYIDVSAPGVEPDSLNVRLEGRALVISGKLPEAHSELYSLCKERPTGTFERTVPLPELFVADEVQARYRNGIVYVTLPKPRTARPQVIPVQMEK